MIDEQEPMPPQPYLFVTVGSTDFDALVRQVDEVVPALNFNAGIMQIGSGCYLPVHLPYFRFAPTLFPYYLQSSLVVAHGGLAVTMEVLERGLPLISVSNPDRYDKHQDDLLAAMAADGYLIWCRKLDRLEDAIREAQRSTMRRYAPPTCQIHQVIDQYLSALG